MEFVSGALRLEKAWADRQGVRFTCSLCLCSRCQMGCWSNVVLQAGGL